VQPETRFGMKQGRALWKRDVEIAGTYVYTYVQYVCIYVCIFFWKNNLQVESAVSLYLALCDFISVTYSMHNVCMCACVCVLSKCCCFTNYAIIFVI